MISEGSCDTEDWSNDAENAFLKYIKTAILNCNNIQQYYIFGQIYAVLVSIR